MLKLLRKEWSSERRQLSELHSLRRSLKNLLQFFLQKVDGQRPCLCRCLLIAHAVSRIDERVSRIVHFGSVILARSLKQLFNLVHLLHRDTRVPSAIESQHMRIDLRHLFGLWVIATWVEWHHGSQVRISRCDNKGHQATDTETYQAQL